MHVADVVAAYDLVLNRSDLAGETLNCGTGETISVREIAEIIGRRLGTRIQYGEPRPGEVETFLLDSTKIKKLGFSPGVGLRDGLERYIQWSVNQVQQGVTASAVEPWARVDIN